MRLEVRALALCKNGSLSELPGVVLAQATHFCEAVVKVT
jgi:hypothetical protein